VHSPPGGLRIDAIAGMIGCSEAKNRDTIMQQIKLFKSVEPDVSVLEQEINDWLKESGAKVINMFGNIAPQTPKETSLASTMGRAFAPSDLLVAILYETE
jgi:hypothetical protein